MKKQKIRNLDWDGRYEHKKLSTMKIVPQEMQFHIPWTNNPFENDKYTLVLQSKWLAEGLNKDIFILYQRVQLNMTLFFDFRLKLLFMSDSFTLHDIFFTGLGIITDEFFFNIDFFACNFELFTKLLDNY